MDGIRYWEILNLIEKLVMRVGVDVWEYVE